MDLPAYFRLVRQALSSSEHIPTLFFTIPIAERLRVYQYFDGGAIQFAVPVLVALVFAVIAALFAFLIGLPVRPQVKNLTIWQSPLLALLLR